jgi:hypothetical protein
MYTKVKLDRKTIIIPFSSTSQANFFQRGFNEYFRFQDKGHEYYPENTAEYRGVRFATTYKKYCEKHGIPAQHYIGIYADKENTQSLFDGFE